MGSLGNIINPNDLVKFGHWSVEKTCTLDDSEAYKFAGKLQLHLLQHKLVQAEISLIKHLLHKLFSTDHFDIVMYDLTL